MKLSIININDNQSINKAFNILIKSKVEIINNTLMINN